MFVFKFPYSVLILLFIYSFGLIYLLHSLNLFLFFGRPDGHERNLRTKPKILNVSNYLLVSSSFLTTLLLLLLVTCKKEFFEEFIMFLDLVLFESKDNSAAFLHTGKDNEICFFQLIDPWLLVANFRLDS